MATVDVTATAVDLVKDMLHLEPDEVLVVGLACGIGPDAAVGSDHFKGGDFFDMASPEEGDLATFL